MRFVALATDFDGTLAREGRVSARTLDALQRLRASGRRLLMVTGRELRDLRRVFSDLELFDLLVLENGATLYFPLERREELLADPPPAQFVEACRERGVAELAAGRIVVATSEEETPKVLEVIHTLGLELQPIFNRGSVMILPSGVNKATGLAAALKHLGLSPHNVVAVGDAENDHAFLSFCECGAAVANALPALKARADIVTAGSEGDGVTELIEGLIRDDLADMNDTLLRHDIRLGRTPSGEELCFPVYSRNLLIAGLSEGGRSTIARAFVEQLLDARYQVCFIDPEGDYEALGDAVVLGEPKSPPTPEAALAVLEKPERSLVLNLSGVPYEDRPAFFQSVMTRARELRLRTGRPHWVVIDEAHLVLPADRPAQMLAPGQNLLNTALITARPEQVARDAVAIIDALIAVGNDSGEAARAWSAATGIPVRAADVSLDRGNAILWQRDKPGHPLCFEVAESQSDRARHSRKYASGQLPPDRSFYFRGAKKMLNLRAENLTTFLRIADGVDEETWLHHLKQGDYSHWLRTEIHSDELADEAQAIEREARLAPDESRAKIREAIEKRFTIQE